MFNKVGHNVFLASRNRHARGQRRMYPHVASDAVCWLADDGKSGFAVNPDGEVCHVFSNKFSRITRDGNLKSILEFARAHGGTYGKLFDGRLARLYKRYGAVQVAREAFDPKKAPEGWNYEEDGRPDVVTLKWHGVIA